MIEKFSLPTLAAIDGGRVHEAFKLALARCLADCKDRPALKDARKLSLSVTIEPLVGEDGSLESCNVQFQIIDSVPKRKSKTYNMKASDSGLLFNELSPADVRQGTLDQAPLRKVSDAQ